MTKHTNCIITYQKNNGNIIMKPKLSDANLKIGDETSMGWKVLNIHYEYNGNYYVRKDYIRLLKQKPKKKIRDKIISYIIRKLRKLVNNYNDL